MHLAQKENKKADLKLTLQDFIKIFKSDRFSEQISQIIRKEIYAENVSKINFNHTKPFQTPVPDPYASKNGKRNITISMKDENGIVEIPIDSDLGSTINVYKRELTKNGHVNSKKTFKVDDKTETYVEENYQEKLEEKQ